MTYILKRTDQSGGYVVDRTRYPHIGSSYVRDILKAKRYETKEQAIADSCPGNEIPVNFHELINQ